MLLAIDAGNTNIVFAVYDGEKQKAQWRGETGAGSAVLLAEIAEKFSTIDAIIVSSVVPKINSSLQMFCKKEFEIDPIFVPHENAGIKIMIDNPHEVGADRLVDAVAACAHYQKPAIIVDFGTATTFDVVDEQGQYCGGVIAPGINLSLEALHQAAAKLPKVEVEKPEKIIGQNTKHAMQSGIYWGYISLIEGMVNRVSDEMGCKPFVIATGGLAPLFSKGTDIFDVVDGELIMKGLVYIHSQICSEYKRKSA